MLDRHADGSIDTLESEFEQVCQPTAPQVIQLSAKLVDNIHHLILLKVDIKRFDGYICDDLVSPIGTIYSLTPNS